MLIASCLFKEDGTLLESQIPNIVVGDKGSVKLEVSFYEDYENLKLLDLSQYVVEAVFERPDEKVSPALLLGIDIENNTKKYLVFGGWLTEIAGISKITIRLKKDGTVKATGFLPLTIQDGNAPADVVITEPQFEALENAINAEEQARILAVQNEANARNNADSQLQANIDKEIQDRKDAISEESMYRQQQDNLINQRIDEHEEEIEMSFNKQNEKINVINQILNLKLNKIFSDVAIASDLALTDYLVINAGTTAYRITVEQLQNIVSQKTDYFKGQYSSLKHLQSAHPSGEGGDYAYVDTEFTREDGTKYYQFVMYVYDVEDQRWEETTSSQYLGVTTFQAFQESLLNGTFEIGSIKGNVDLIGGEPVLKSVFINGVSYSVPTIEVTFSNKNAEDANDLGSVTINDDKWNVATPTQIKELEEKTKVVDKEFKEFKSGAVAGQKFKVGYKITLDNVSDKSQNSLGYYFFDEQGVVLDIYYNHSKKTFMWVLTREDDRSYEGEGLEYVFEYDMFLDEAVNDYDGEGLLGTWNEKQLTAQEVYDNTKLKDNSFKLTLNQYGIDSIPREKMQRGLYQVVISAPNYLNFCGVFYWEAKNELVICIPTQIEDSNNELINAFIQFENLIDYPNEVLVSVIDGIGDPIQMNLETIVTLTRILE